MKGRPQDAACCTSHGDPYRLAERRVLPAFFASYLVAVITAPAAIRIAHRAGFLDRPAGYKAHGEPTPYLGGVVVLVGFLAGAMAHLAVQESHLVPLFVGAAFLWAVGTVDDRVALGPRVRVVAEVLAGLLLWRSGLGWSIFPGALPDLLITVLWVVGIVNAFNLMDNIDGATATVGGVSAAGIALLAAYEGPEGLTALAVAVSGACVGFLHFNLTRPARIFLGDGGSMLLGFLIAGLTMAVWRLNVMPGPALLPAIMLAGLPILDMTLVVVSRVRHRIPVYQGGRDHITHRLLPKLGSPRGVALALALGQGVLSLAAIELMTSGREAMFVGAAVAFVLGMVTIAIFETPFLLPEWYGSTAGKQGPSATRDASASAAQRSTPGSGGRWATRSTSTPRRRGATSGRSIPKTELGP
jgi:UDP-GlcNAc:undecaprenyl-phosphate GlcNAc-1-phosphate transferase